MVCSFELARKIKNFNLFLSPDLSTDQIKSVIPKRLDNIDELVESINFCYTEIVYNLAYNRYGEAEQIKNRVDRLIISCLEEHVFVYSLGITSWSEKKKIIRLFQKSLYQVDYSYLRIAGYNVF